MTPTRSTDLRLRLVTVFVVGLVMLTLEIAYTRVISFKLFYYYTYFVIGLALLGMGAGSAIVALSRRLRSSDPLRLVRIAAPITGVVGVISYAVVARLGTTTDLIWIGSGRQAVGQIARLMVLSISLTAVFLALGIILAALIVAEAHEVRRLYFWDLAGAALACLVAVPLQAVLSPPSIILGCSVLLVLLGLAVTVGTRPDAAATGAGEHRPTGGGRALIGGVGAAVGVAILAVAVGTLDVRPDTTKTLSDDDVPVAGGWGPVFRVDVIDLDGFMGAHVLVHDGLWGSAIWRFDGTPATTERFERDSRRIAFDAVGTGDERPDRILIIGAAGGNEIQAALTYGVGHVDAVELNPVTVGLLRDEFAEYSGNIAHHPQVDYIRGDGRTFLARSDEEYDLIWFVAPDSYAAANAATSGAFVLSESYLYTEEMIQKAYDRLSDRGIIIAQFGDFDFANRPNRTARYLVTARSALEGRLGEFADHTALVVDDADADLGRLTTIGIARNPLDRAAIERIAATVDELAASRLVHLPGIAGDPSITAEIIRGDDATVAALVAAYPYDISSITDDRPFFWHFTRFAEVLTDWRGIEDTEIAIGERLLLVLLAISAVVAAALLGLPFLVTRSREDATPVARRGRLFGYFALLGVGFMLVEISMIQRFALLLGYPTLSLSVSLFTLLIATAFGARWSGWVRNRPAWGVPAVSAALAIVALIYLVTSTPLTDAALGWPSWARIVIVIVLLFPVGLLLGTFLPHGIDLALAAAGGGPAEGRLIAWCWAVNGFFSVIGALATTMLSMTFGFDRTLIIGLVLYFVAAGISMATPRTPALTGSAPEPVLTAPALTSQGR